MCRTHTDIAFPPGAGRSQRGVTLLELAATMAITCLLLGLGLPSYQHMIQQRRADTTRHLLLSHFASARMTAITHRKITAVCPSDGPDTGCRQDGDWSHGWLMFFDPDGDRRPNLPEDLLRHEAVSLPDGFRIRSSSGRPQLRYLPTGMSTGSNLTVRICLQERLMTEVVVNNGGRARSRGSDPGERCQP